MRSLEPLFASHTCLRGVIASALEGRLGSAVVDDADNPNVARLDIGCYAILGGDATQPAAAELVASASVPNELVVPADQTWRDLLVATWGNRLTDRPMRTFATHRLNVEQLQRFAAAIRSGFSIAPIDESLAEQLDDRLIPHAMQVFPTVADFATHGIGYGVVHEGELVSAATSYTISNHHVEIAISTREDHRNLGLARAVAAHMINACLDRSLIPDWSASNPTSKRLALSLGYLPAPICDIFYLEPISTSPVAHVV